MNVRSQARPRVSSRPSGAPRAALAASTGLAAVLLSSVAPAARAQSPIGPADLEGAVTLQQTGGFFQANFQAKDDRQRPVFQLAYLQRDDLRLQNIRQGQRRLLLTRPDAPELNEPIRGLTLLGFDLKASPSGGSAPLFGSGRVAAGAQVAVSFGQSYLRSSLPSFNSVHQTTALANYKTIVDDWRTADDKVLAGFVRSLDTSFLPFFERRLTAVRTDPQGENPQRDPFWAQQLEAARSLRDEIQNRMGALSAPPGKPENVRAAPGPQSVTLAWDGVPGALSYTVKRSSDGGQTFLVAKTGLTAPAFTDSPLASGTPFTYVVTAINGKGQADSDGATATPLPPGAAGAAAAPPAAAPPVAAPPAAIGKKGGLLGTPIYDAWNARIAYISSRDTFYDSSAPFEGQFTDREFRGYSARVGYQANYGGRLPFIVALAGGRARTNNAANLTEVEVTEQSVLTSPDGGTQRISTTKRKGLRGTERISENWTLSADVVLYPDLLRASADPERPRSSVALAVFARANPGRDGDNVVWGGGAYLTQPGNPLKVYGGLNVFQDANRKLAVSLVAGYPF